MFHRFAPGIALASIDGQVSEPYYPSPELLGIGVVVAMTGLVEKIRSMEEGENLRRGYAARRMSQCH